MTLRQMQRCALVRVHPFPDDRPSVSVLDGLGGYAGATRPAETGLNVGARKGA
jgi:hypothetical protein